MSFDFAPGLKGETLNLSPLTRADLPAVLAAISDPLIWAGHPDTERWRPERASALLEKILTRGGGMVVRENAAGRVIGLSRFYPVIGRPDAVAIGYTFLVRDHWGGRSNAEMKALMLDHALAGFAEVQFHVAPTNLRSQAAMARIGARRVFEGMIEMEDGPVDYVVFAMSQDDRARSNALSRAGRARDHEAPGSAAGVRGGLS